MKEFGAFCDQRRVTQDLSRSPLSGLSYRRDKTGFYFQSNGLVFSAIALAGFDVS